ncbi:MAG: putative beta-lysine N-acetyltransferase, partial [Mariniphaga sp.]|nr:putative beta-lysine N-acetyltransferase [Mariniphaga sp.]
MEDKIEKFGQSILQHGKLNDRIYLQKSAPADIPDLIVFMNQLAQQENYTKIFAKIRVESLPLFVNNGYCMEAFIPQFFNGYADGVMVSKFLSETRRKPPVEQLHAFYKLLENAKVSQRKKLLPDFTLIKLKEDDSQVVAELFKKVFTTYPFPVHDSQYILQTMQSHAAKYFGVLEGNQLVGVSTAEIDVENRNVEMTDFAVLPKCRGKKLAWHLLDFMEQEMRKAGIINAYTIARLAEPGINKTFMNAGYKFSGTLVNNTQIAGSI